MVKLYNRLRGYPYGIQGIHWDSSRQKYRVKFTRNRKQIHIGRYQRLRDAKAAAVKFIKDEAP